MSNHSIVIHSCDSLIQSEVLEASYFGEDVMEDTPLVYAFGKTHFLYGYFSRRLQVGLTAVYDSISASRYLLPAIIMTQISKNGAKQF